LPRILDGRIAQSMAKNGELTEALKAMKDVADNTSWFRGTSHCCARASLPIACAMSFVKVVSKMSGKARYSHG